MESDIGVSVKALKAPNEPSAVESDHQEVRAPTIASVEYEVEMPPLPEESLSTGTSKDNVTRLSREELRAMIANKRLASKTKDDQENQQLEVKTPQFPSAACEFEVEVNIPPSKLKSPAIPSMECEVTMEVPAVKIDINTALGLHVEHADSVTAAEQALAEAKAAELVALAQEVAEQCNSDGGNAQNDAPSSESNNQKRESEAWFKGHMISAAAEPAVALEVIRSAFNLIDKNNDRVLSRIEVIKALRGSVVVRLLLQLPQYIKQEDGTRELFEQIFQEIDVDNSNDITLHEFGDYFYKKRGWFRGTPPDMADVCESKDHRSESRSQQSAVITSVKGALSTTKTL